MSEQRQVNCNVSIETTIGRYTVKVTYAEITLYGSEAFTATRLGNAGRAAVDSMADSMANHGGPAFETAPTGDSGSAVIRVDRVSVSHKDGKRYIKFHGGKYTKFGITVWPEMLAQIGVTADQIPDAGFTPKSDIDMSVSVDQNGRPRVVGLVKKEVLPGV